MRRRALVLGVPVGLAVLGACGPEATEADPAALPDPPSDLEPEPVSHGEKAETVDLSTVSLPLEMTTTIVVDPGWTSTPLERDGMFLAYDDTGDRLRFIAADQDGTVLWEAERPLSCTGFMLSQDEDGRAIAALADIAPGEEGAWVMTLSGYDLRTAETLWGPTEVPGPQAGQGLVFAAAGDRPMGDSQPRIALSAATGESTLAEEDLDGGRILAEHGGVILHTAGGELVAVTAADGEELWRTALPGGLEPQRARIVGAIDPTTQLAVLGDGDSAGTVLDLSDGSLVAEEADAVARDHLLDVTVVASGTVVRGLELDGEEAWRHEDPEELVFVSAGGRLAYAQRPEEGTLVVLDVGQGLMVHPYDVDVEAPLGVPEVFSLEAAAAVRVQNARYLVTTELDENFGRR